MDKKVLKWNFVFQYGFVITNILGGLILFPFYLKNIDKAILGVWIPVNSILSWMTLLDPGTGEVLQQKIAELRGRGLKDEVSKTIGSGFIASGFILVISIIAGFIFYSLIGVIINKDVTQYHNLQTAIFISIISTGLSLVSFGLSGINQGLHNVTQVAISAILANILFIVINLLLLELGYGLISIAFANLCRGLFVNVYNFFAVKSAIRLEGINFIFNWPHFKNFIKIFSFTSVASIIGGLSASMDMIFLARFISPGMITVFETNKRPIQLSQSLVGRHSVALMPLISHAAGKDDREGILNLIGSQFKYYSYGAIFIGLAFYFNYKNLVLSWTRRDDFYAGSTITNLLILNFFFGLIGYFMANMGYALGDIKVNSLINILKGLITGALYYLSAKYYGIIGVLSVMLASVILIDLFLFSHRLYKLTYLKRELVLMALKQWSVTILVMFFIGTGLTRMYDYLFVPGPSIIKLLVNGFSFTAAFITVILVFDKQLRKEIFELFKIKMVGNETDVTITNI